MAEIQEVKISDIISDQAIQSRARIDQEAVSDYAQHIDDLPPILLFQDGDKLYLTEGFHRYSAHVMVKRAKIKAEIREGTRDEAILHSAGANATNGVHRSAEDKRRSVSMLLSNPEWEKKSSRWIAEIAKVSHELVNRIREELNPGGAASTVGKDGKARKSPKKSSKSKSSAAREPAEEAKLAMNDRAGKVIKRAEAQVLFGQAEMFTALKSATGALKRQFVELADQKVGAFLDRQAIDDAIQNLYNIIESARPYTECPYCAGNPKPSCKVCRKTGVVSRQVWDTAIPIEIKEGDAATDEDRERAKKTAEPRPEPKKDDAAPDLDDTIKIRWKLNGKGADKEFTEKTAAGLNKRFIDRGDKSRWVKSE